MFVFYAASGESELFGLGSLNVQEFEAGEAIVGIGASDEFFQVAEAVAIRVPRWGSLVEGQFPEVWRLVLIRVERLLTTQPRDYCDVACAQGRRVDSDVGEEFQAGSEEPTKNVLVEKDRTSVASADVEIQV